MATKVITLPNGRSVSIAAYVAAIETVKRNPRGMFKGWDYLPTPGREILFDFGRLVTDMINRHLAMPSDNRGATARLLKRLRRDGRECRWCGTRFQPASINDKCCCNSCRQAYHS